MGGASRNEQRRKQEAAGARLAAAGITPPPPPNRTPRIIVMVVLGVVALAAIGIWIYQQTATEDVAPTYAATLTATPEGAVVVAGNGPVVVDLYSDFLCPNCERFESRYGNEINKALNDGKITVRYHGVAILDGRTDPPGYATRAANAALCAAQAGVFPAYKDRLYTEQPAEGSAGLSNAQLIAFGADVGAQGGFAECVNGNVNAAAIAAGTTAAAATPSLTTNGQFGTPTVAIGGQKVDLNDTDWLARALP